VDISFEFCKVSDNNGIRQNFSLFKTENINYNNYMLSRLKFTTV